MSVIMKKILTSALAVVLVLALCLPLAACGGQKKASGKTGSEKKTTSSSTKSSAQTSKSSSKSSAPSGSVKLAPVYAAYKKILQQNEKAIRAYTWQGAPGQTVEDGKKGIGRPCALADLNGDGTPELCFMTASTSYQATLMIFTYYGGAPHQVSYSGFEDYGGVYSDALAAGGCTYVLYKTGKSGQFGLYETTTDESIISTIHVFSFDGKKASQTQKLQNIYGPGANGETSDKYTLNGKSISADAGKKNFTSLSADLTQAILFSGGASDKGNSIWKRFTSGDALCVSYDAMIKKLG